MDVVTGFGYSTKAEMSIDGTTSFTGAEMPSGYSPAAAAYWAEVDSLISTYGGAYWPMADNGNGDDLQCTVTADALDQNDAVGSPTYVTEFSSYPALRGVTADNGTNYKTAGGVDASWATTGDFTHIVAVTIPASFGTGQLLWEVDGAGAGSGASASWGRLVFDSTTAAKVVWEDSGGTQRTANFTKGAGTWASQDNYFIVTHDSTSRTWSLYEDVSGTVTLVGTDTYTAGQGPSGGVASNKVFGTMKRPTTGTNYLDTGWVVGSQIRIPDLISTSEMQTFLDAARTAQTTYFDAALTSDLEEDATKFTSTFSRASSKWDDVSGTLTEFTTDNPSFGDTGLSLSGQVTNYCRYSDDWTNTGWVSSGASVASGVSSPQILGRNTSSITDSGSGGGYAEFQTTDLLGVGNTIYGAVRLVSASGTVNVKVGVWKNGVLQGTETSATIGTTSEIVQVAAATDATFDYCDLRITVVDAGGVVYGNLAHISSKQGVATIPTSGSNVTKAADNCSYGISGCPTNDFTLSYTYLADNATNARVTLYTDTSNYLTVFISTSTITVQKRIGGTFYNITGVNPALTEGTEYEITFTQSSTAGMSVSCNGVSGTNADTTAIAEPVTLFPGSTSSAVATSQEGQIKNLKVTS